MEDRRNIGESIWRRNGSKGPILDVYDDDDDDDDDNDDLFLCSAGVYSLCDVPMDGQCSLNIQRPMSGIYVMSGTICY